MFRLTSTLDFGHFRNITRDLNKTSIKTFRFKGINCLAGMSGNILKRSLQYLQNTQISEINFEKKTNWSILNWDY